MTLKTLFVFLFTLSFCSVQGQKFVFLNYNVDDGLAHSQVRSLFQDKNGVLWVGSLGGVSKYDGQGFTNFSTDDGLVNNDVRAIEQLANGDLIFGSVGGVAIYNGRAFTAYKFSESWKSASINKFYCSGDSILICSEKGLMSYRNNKVSYFPTFLPKDDMNLKSITKVEEGFLFLTKNSLYLWNYDGFKPVLSAAQVSEQLNEEPSSFMDMVIDAEGRIYISTAAIGLIEYVDGNIDNLSIKEGMVSNVLGNVYLDDRQDIMVCSKNGLSHIKENEIYSFTEKNGLEFSDVKAVLKDSEGRFWIGTNGGGLFKFTGYSFTYFNQDDGLSSDVVMTINSSENGEMGFGTFDEGVSIAQANEWNYLSGDELKNNKIWTSTTDGKGRVWYGSSGGINVIENGKSIRSIAKEEGLDYSKVTFLFHDENSDVIWAGTSRGLNKIIGDSVVQMTEFLGSRIRSIEKKGNALFLGSRQGLWKYEKDTFELIDIGQTTEDKTVYCIKSLDSVLWVGAKTGLFRVTETSAQEILLSSNFSSKTINFLESDPDGNIWAGTNLGLFKISPELEVESFTKQDGLVSLETNLNSVFSDEENLWFGTSKALQRLNFKELKQAETLNPPSVVLKEVRLNLEKTIWSKEITHFMPSSNIPISPAVKHRDNNFSFRFHAKSIEEASNLRYQYMLEGFDENWQPITEEASATYTNLPFKSFKFKVRAKRLSQDWGEPLYYDFSITPPFWQTWWFILVAVLAGSYLSFSIFQYRRKNLITALEKEKFEIKSKMLALEQQSLNSSMNRHFIFNALNSIQYYINRQDRLSANRYLSSFAKLIRKNLDSSQVNFTTLSDELERLGLYLEIENMRFKDKFEYEINIAESVDEEVVKIPSMLLQPFLENSIWHGILPQEKKGKISVDIDKNELGQMEIRIKDNGIGIHTSQAQKNGKAEHISQGMNITSGRIELLQKITTEKVTLIGPFEMKNEWGEVLGTQVTIKLPMEYREELIG